MIEREQNGNSGRARSLVIDAFVGGFSMFGFRERTGHLFGVIFLHDGPMTFEEITAETGYSAISVNDSLHGLVELDAVQEVGEEDGIPVFDVQKSHMRLTRHEFPEMSKRVFEGFVAVLEDAERHLEASDSAAAVHYRQRVSQLKEYAEFVESAFAQHELIPESLLDLVYGQESRRENA